MVDTTGLSGFFRRLKTFDSVFFGLFCQAAGARIPPRHAGEANSGA